MDHTTTWLSNTSNQYEIEEQNLSWVDYLLLSALLLTSFLVGIYFGLAKNKAHTTSEYLFGGKSISLVPIAFSLIATQISGTTMVAVPADTYKFGSNYMWILLADVIAFTITLYIFLPIFFNLQLVSIFEYLELRFDKRIRRLTSLLNLVSVLSYSPIVIYIPALALAQATGLSVYTITITVCAMCILYTTIGGIKAVIWTDAIQFFVMVSAMFSILIIGAKSVGGLKKVIETSTRHGRFDIFNFSSDVTSRDTFWAPFVGGLFFSLSITSVNQGCIQKYLALPTYIKVKNCVLLHLIGAVSLKASALLVGNVVFAKYADCDILESKKIRTDQLVPYFVMEIANNLPGLPGLFLAGLFSASLSSLSSSLNGTAANVHDDFIVPFIPKNTTQRAHTNIIKAVVVILGVLSVLLVIIVEKVGGVFPFTTGLQGISGGPMLGIFILGFLFPTANAKGALVGAISGLVFTGWIVFGNTWYRINNLLPDESKPTSTEKCDIYSNHTFSAPETKQEVFILYRICFWYYTLISTAAVVIVGIIVSYITKENNVTVNPELISSAVHCFLPKRTNSSVYYSVSQVKEDKNEQNAECCNSTIK